jgi:hypothetical protein
MRLALAAFLLVVTGVALATGDSAGRLVYAAIGAGLVIAASLIIDHLWPLLPPEQPDDTG